MCVCGGGGGRGVGGDEVKIWPKQQHISFDSTFCCDDITLCSRYSRYLQSYDVDVVQWITLYNKNHITTREITFKFGALMISYRNHAVLNKFERG